MRAKMDYRFLECAKKMPPCFHSEPGRQFDISKSEVAAWLASQPDIMQKIFDMAQNKKVIKYDPETKKWKGADYHDD